MDNRKETLKKVREILVATGAPQPLGLFSANPRIHKAFLYAAPVVLISMLVSQLLIGTIIAAVVFYVVWQTTPPETWSERFCKLMAAYQPLDEAAYQALLIKIKDGSADREAVLSWFQTESAHVERPGEVAAERALLASRLKS